MKNWPIRLVKFLVIVEVIYLLVINAALNLPLTQSVVNRIKPEKFTVTWDRAWSPYPFRVYAQNIFANGQSRSQQWQTEAPAACASISLTALLWRTVKLKAVGAQDVIYSQRPRPKPDRDYSKTRPYFPPIDNRELETDSVAQPPKKKNGKAWKVSIADIYAHGRHKIWLYQIQGEIEGELRTNLSYKTRGGPFSLSNGEVDINLESLVINGNHEVMREGHIKGRVALLPFVPKENKGIKVLSFLNVDAKVQTETESLEFLNIYLANFNGMKVDGKGQVEGRLHMRQGRFDDGSDIKVAAREMSMAMLGGRLEGEGSISIKTADTGEHTDASILFTRLEAFDSATESLLFSGDGVSVEAQGNRDILPNTSKPFIVKRLAITVPEVEVPDLKAYQAFLPDKWVFKMHGGKGKLQGFAELTPTSLNGDLQLSSEAADVGIKEHRFNSNLDMALKIGSSSIASGIDVSGSYVHLKGAILSNGAQQTSKPWHADVEITQGKIKLLLPEEVSDDPDFQEIYHALKGKEIVTMLDSSGEEIQVTGSVSDLSWLSVLLKNRLGMSIKGTGAVKAAVILSKGWLGKGSKLVIPPQALGIELLDYSMEGEGKGSMLVEKGGERPSLKLNVELTQGEMRRKEETQAVIENVEILLQALVRDVTIGEKELDMDLHLQIPRARVRDMSVYNQYLPPHSPLEFTGGRAELSSDIRMTPETANGYVKLKTTDISARIDQQDVEGELSADISLIDGVPENMDFDISGSSVTLDNVRVVGTEASHDDENWSARFLLKKARAIWKRPVNIHLEADFAMTDSKPIVAVIANQRGKHSWLEKALTIDDMNGEAVINMSKDRIIVPHAFAASDKIDIGAKGVITAEKRDGVLYVRFRKLHGILKIRNDKRNLDVLNAREKFKEYDSETVLLGISRVDSSTATTKKVKEGR